MSQRYPYWSGKKADQINMLTNCLAAWPTLGPMLGFPPAEVTAFSLLLTEFAAVLNEIDQCQIAVKAANEWRNEVAFGPETNKPAPPPPPIITPTEPTINNGFLAQLKRWRSQILSAPNFTDSIGEALALLGPMKPNKNPNMAQPDMKVAAGEDYYVNFSGSLQGYDSMDVEYQRKGSVVWENIGYLTKTPGSLRVTPTTPGTAEIGALRCRFVKANEQVGVYSSLYVVTIS